MGSYMRHIETQLLFLFLSDNDFPLNLVPLGLVPVQR